MCADIRLFPGNPNDANREYLPEGIKGSDMVVNENGNNSQPYPAGLLECHGTIADQVEDTWYEYVPASYQGDKKVPLVFSMHGGLMSGWGQAVYTCWVQVAEREGFIVVFPNASKRRVWTIEIEAKKRAAITTPNEENAYLNAPPDDIADNHDIRFVLGLMEHIKSKYKIDETRVFMQGMSMGDLMTSQFTRHYGYLLAGSAGSGAPVDPGLLFSEDGQIKNAGGGVDIWQSRLELDAVAPHYHMETQQVVAKNLAYWKTVNQCEPIPQIKIIGEKNLAFFNGKAGHVVLCDVKNRDHGQTFDDAELVWDYLFSGASRGADGSIQHGETLLPRTGDTWALAAATDRSQVFFRNRLVAMDAPAIKHQKLKYHGLNGDSVVRDEYICVPLTMIAHVFGAELTFFDEGLSAELTLSTGVKLQIARGNTGCIVDGKVESMYCEAIWRGGFLYISLAWFCRRMYNMHVSICDGVLYATDHDAQLSLNMAVLIKELLQGKPQDATTAVEGEQ